MKYKIRFFYSKGAFLVLLWQALQSATWWSFTCLYKPIFDSYQKNSANIYFIALFAFGLFFLCAPLSGWLADTRFGNYKVFKVGMIAMFIATILLCVYVLFTSNWLLSEPVRIVLICSVFAILMTSVVMFIVTALQLGLDQMPDASAENITSYIMWFVFAMSLGIWCCDTIWILMKNCIINRGYDGIQVFSLLPVACMSLSCCILFFFGSKWLTVEPNSPQALRIIYQVLRFAWKHKTPLNRSALTYWEENIPSRMDLGKSRYGGPFTTEQVENVKTFFKIVILQIPFYITSLSLWHTLYRVHKMSLLLPNVDICQSTLTYVLTYHPSLLAMAVILVSEFIVYPCVRMQPPSILRQIGILYFVIMLGSAVILTFHVVDLVYKIHMYYVFEYIFLGCLGFDVLIKFQFVCAQSPYNMRGLLAGYTVFIFMLSIILGILVYQLIVVFAPDLYNNVVHTSVAAVLSLVGFVLYCILARWYKRRVRDEEYCPHKVVEEVYDRYLSYYN